MTFSYTFPGINSALVGLCQDLISTGIERKMNGFQKSTAPSCVELPGPCVIEITDPTARQVLIPERKWNKILPMAESLWIALGSNDLDDLPGHFVKSIYNYSDDGRTWRAGYGSRIRGFSGVKNPYDRPIDRSKKSDLDRPLETVVVDQLKYVVETLSKEPTSRQALITIHDPAKDSISDLVTKDIPCTRDLHFLIVEGRLNLYVYMRTADLIFGFSAVNMYNFSLMQQYVAKILGVPLGSYFHYVDNLHYYENKKELVETLASFDVEKAKEFDRSLHNDYNDRTNSLDELDFVAVDMYQKEEEFWKLSNSKNVDSKVVFNLLQNIKDNYPDLFFRGWLYAFPLAMKNIQKEVKEWLIENGESENKMIAQFF